MNILKEVLIRDSERLEDLQYKNLSIIQDKEGYCFTSDAVELSNFAKVKKKGILVDLCSGSGVVGILTLNKNDAKICHMVELQPRLIEMAKRSVEYNNQQNLFVFHNNKLQGIAKEIGYGFADTVTANPPYMTTSNKILTENNEKNIAKFEIEVTLEEVINEASKLLKFGGKLYIVHKEERLSDIVCFSRKYGLEVKVIKIKKGRASNIILVEALKGGKSGCKIICD